jgi:nitronate monooxygenase
MALPSVLRDGLRLPVIGAPMFIVSTPDLVIAQCKAGIVGAFPALNARPAPVLADWLEQITRELREHDLANPTRPAAPFAVNQIVHKSNDRLMHDLELCVKFKVPIIITSLGAREDLNQAVHEYGGVVLHDVINQKFARKAIEKGADGLILVAAGAGGHAGTTSPLAFVQETRQWFDGPIALSGAIATGRAILAAQAMGADLAYIGSAFIATEEANAKQAYKETIVEGRAEDIVYTNHFSGVHGNYLRQSIVNAGLDPDHLPQSDPSKMDFAASSNTTAKAWRDIWGAGQGIGAVREIVKAADFVERLEREYVAAKERLLEAATRPQKVAAE